MRSQFQDPLCKRCKHPKSDHVNAVCTGLGRDKDSTPHCDCREFVPKHADESQAVVQVAREPTEGN
jgi:hypothetical protein